MKNAKQLLPVLTILVFVSLSCSFLKENAAKLSGGSSVPIPSIPAYDPEMPIVSPGAYVLRIMAKGDPAVAAMTGEFESVEKRLIQRVVDEYKNPAAPTPSPTRRGSVTLPRGRNPMAMNFMLQSGSLALPNYGDGLVFGAFTGFLKKMLSDAFTDQVFNKKDSKTEKVEGGTSQMSVEMGANPDGSSVFEIGIVTEIVKNGVKIRTETKSRIEGQDCPNAEGQVPITIKMKLGGQSGNSKYSQDVTAFVRVVVDDNAEVASTTIDVSQATESDRNGRHYFAETGATYRSEAGKSGYEVSNARTVQQTDDTSGDDAQEATTSGFSVALGAAQAAIAIAEMGWKGGGCVKIDARSPGTVGPNSGTEIPVKVRHRKDGSEVFAKLDVALEGETSIDPNLIPKTPGTLMYVAPAETGKTATIKLKATSRRGIATLDLTASTGTNSYRIAGGLDAWQTDTVVCDITKPFTLTGGGFTMKLSGGTSGTYEYTGPYNAKGTGTYEITFPNGPERAAEMVGRGPGSIEGDGKTYSGAGTERYTLTPVTGECVDGPAE